MHKLEVQGRRVQQGRKVVSCNLSRTHKSGRAGVQAQQSTANGDKRSNPSIAEYGNRHRCFPFSHAERALGAGSAELVQVLPGQAVSLSLKVLRHRNEARRLQVYNQDIRSMRGADT